MKRTLINYTTKADATAENQRLVENVFKELHAKSPDGFRYAVIKLEDGSFLHFFENEGATSPVSALGAFQTFQSGVKDRAQAPPQVRDATIVGNYRMLVER
jgi:hypothetical protein